MMQKYVVSSWLCTSCMSNWRISTKLCPIFLQTSKISYNLCCAAHLEKNFILLFLFVQNAGEDLGVLEGAKPSKDRGGIQQEETILPGQDPFRVEPVQLNGMPGSCRAALYRLLFVA